MANNKRSNKRGAAGKTEAAKRGGMNSGGNTENLPNVESDTTAI